MVNLTSYPTHVSLFGCGLCVIDGYCQHCVMQRRLPTTFYLW